MSAVEKNRADLEMPRFHVGENVFVNTGAAWKAFRVASARLDITCKKWEYALDGYDRQLIAPEEALRVVEETRDFIGKAKQSIDKATQDTEVKATTPEQPDGESSALDTATLKSRNPTASQKSSVSQFDQELEALRQRCNDLEAQIYRQQQLSPVAPPTLPTSMAQSNSGMTAPERKYICKIWGSVLIIYSFCSIAFALGWGISKKDAPGGATMAGWMIALGALLYSVFGKKHTSKCRCWEKVVGRLAHS